jgi:glyoxylase-like metal-dependent hydrolase (beta-lactamase superfamily II)
MAPYHTARMGDGWQVYAVKYAERDARRTEHFLGGDPHDAPMPMDYFVWVIVGAHRTWVVDTGFGADDAARRERRLLRSATDALALVGVDAPAATDVILTHLHYDHVGGIAQFPDARFHVQDREVAFATGRHMTRAVLAHGYTGAHVAELVLAVHDARVTFHDGDDQLAPGLTVHHVGGHTAGLQVVRIETGGRVIVLASDATHYYENMDSGRPFPIVHDVGAMLEGFDTLRRLAGPGGVIVPGHDPLVFDRHAAADPSLTGIAVRVV